MSPPTTGVGIVGAGLIGRKRLQACQGDLAVRAVFDVDGRRAAALVATAPGAEAVGSLDALLERPDIDLVIAATTHDQLADITTRALAGGKHVLVEKPAGLGAPELAEARRTATAQDLTVRVGYNHRFHPAIRRARELVAEGGYGRLLWLRARYGHGGRIGYEREWRADRAISGGGELIDQGSHLIDLSRYMFGDVTLAFAELPTAYWPMPVEDNAFLALRPRSGGLAWLHASWSEWKNLFSFEITLERAKIEISGLGGSYGVERLTLFEMSPEMGPPMTTSWEWPFPDGSWSAEMDDVAAAIRGEASIGADLDDGIAVLEIIGEAYERCRPVAPAGPS